MGHLPKALTVALNYNTLSPLQWRIYKGAPPARAPLIENQIPDSESREARANLPPPRKEKISNLAPPLWIFLDPPLLCKDIMLRKELQSC